MEARRDQLIIQLQKARHKILNNRRTEARFRMEREEAMKYLNKLREMAVALCKDDVDDPEEIISDFYGDADHHRRALDVAISALEKSQPFDLEDFKNPVLE